MQMLCRRDSRYQIEKHTRNFNTKPVKYVDL